MKNAPVSFGTIMVFTTDDKKPKENTRKMIETSFGFNYNLNDYFKLETKEYLAEPIDASIYNAAPSFCKFLDKRYKNSFDKNSNKVILTEADFYVNSKEKQKRYFLTAKTNLMETYIQHIIGCGFTIFAAKFYDKND